MAEIAFPGEKFAAAVEPITQITANSSGVISDTILLASTCRWTITKDSDMTWVTAINVAKASADVSASNSKAGGIFYLSFTISTNNTGASRHGYITITSEGISKKIKLTQTA